MLHKTFAFSLFLACAFELHAQTSTENLAPKITVINDPSTDLKSLTEAFSKFQVLYGEVKTLEYTAARRATDSKHDPSLLPESLHFIADGDKYWYDYNSVRLPGRDDFCFFASYDGDYTRKFTKGSGYMTNQRGVGSDGGTLFGHNYIFLPQFFISNVYNPNSGVIVTPKTLANSSTWNDFIARSKLEGKVNLTNRECIVLVSEIKEFSSGLAAKARIYLDPRTSYYPVAWDIVTLDGKLITSYRVSEMATCKIPGGSLLLPYPKAAIRSSFVKDNKIMSEMVSSSEITISDIHINESIDADRLSIDPGMATGIYDIDSKTYIDVPK